MKGHSVGYSDGYVHLRSALRVTNNNGPIRPTMWPKEADKDSSKEVRLCIVGNKAPGQHTFLIPPLKIHAGERSPIQNRPRTLHNPPFRAFPI